MPNFQNILGNIRTTVSNFVNGLVNRTEIHEYPKKDDERVAGWVSQLFEDALAFRKHSFEQTKDGRFGYSDPVRFWQQMAAIASGNHYAAFGTRKVKTDGTDGDIWKSEMIDDETSDQIRVRTAHLTAGWHEVQVMPNVDYIDDVLREERKQTGWGKFVRRSIKNAQQYGFAWAQSYLDKSENPEGIANERVLPVGSVFLSPYATSKAKRDGCWYAIIAENVTGQWVRENLPDFDLSQAGSESHTSERSRNIAINYSGRAAEYDHTKQYSKLEILLDDPTIVPAEFDDEVFPQKVAAVISGMDVPVEEAENHQAHIKGYEQYTTELEEAAQESMQENVLAEEDDTRLQQTLAILQAQIEKHTAIAKETGFPEGYKRLYPHGRHIITLDNQVAYDEPNAYEFDWRNLLNELKNEDVPDRVDGRGDVEIMWNVQKALDENLSRAADLSLLAGIPKKQRHISDKSIVDKEGGENNDPTATDYYATVPPTWQKGPPPSEQLELYTLQKSNAQRKLGITSVTRGDAPTASASGDLAEILASQNEIVVTGELSSNLNDFLTDILETKLLIMRQFYVEPRMFIVNGVQQYLNVSKLLAVTSVVNEQGMQEEIEVKRHEITVVPGSNFPNKWEKDMAIFGQLAQQFPDVIPPEAIRDKIAEKYPQFGNNGRYRMDSEANRIGKQVLAEKQREQEMVQKEMERQERKDVREAVEAQP